MRNSHAGASQGKSLYSCHSQVYPHINQKVLHAEYRATDAMAPVKRKYLYDAIN